MYIEKHGLSMFDWVGFFIGTTLYGTTFLSLYGKLNMLPYVDEVL